MITRLEQRLAEFEMTSTISNDEELIKAIENIINEEEKKSSDIRDFELIDEAIDTILTLKHIDIEQLNNDSERATSSFIESINADKKLATQSKSKILLKRLIPVAAVISILLAISIVSSALGFSVVEITKKAFTQLKEKIFYTEGDRSFIITSDSTEYNSFEELIANEKFKDILYPDPLPDGYSVSSIMVTDCGEFDLISAILLSESNAEVNIEIQTNQSYDYSGLTLQKIGRFDIYVTQYDNLHHAEWCYENNSYIVKSESYDSIKSLLENLKEK